MNAKFKEMLDRFDQANGGLKSEIYDEMDAYAYSYQPGYTCYDMDMYVALYKCARTNQQRKKALEYSQDIVDDVALSHEELIENLKEFISLIGFLKPGDEKKFDITCKKSFDFFKKELEWARDQAKCGQADFIPDLPVNVAEDELKKVSEIIVSTGMNEMESYQAASRVLGL